MDFKWAVKRVTVAKDNLVVKVDLTVTGIEGDDTASAVYSRNLTRGNLVIPFEQLTEQQVLDWCFAPEVITVTNPMDNTATTITKMIKDEGETQVAEQIARQSARKAAEPALPWA